MADLRPELEGRIRLIASDRESGASEVLDEVLRIIADAMRSAADIRTVARALCRAQPSMAPVWNAALEAIAATRDPGRFELFAQRVARGPGALARFAIDCFTADAETRPLRLVTLSFSRSVAVVVETLHQVRPVRISCNEGRPALEGRRLASRLAASGLLVTCFSDAAIAQALASADAVVIGADAVGPEWFLNKVGTRMLAAAASQQGVPVYVLATRDKFVSHALSGRLVVREGAPGEIWESAPTGVEVRNPYFESTPLDLVTSVVTDVGVLGAAMVPDICDRTQDALILQALDEVGG